MYSSIFGGITTDASAMVIPLDDHMVHRGHGVFDTAAIVDGLYIILPPVSYDSSNIFCNAYDGNNHHLNFKDRKIKTALAAEKRKTMRHLYEFDQHLDRILRSASLAKINLPFDRENIRRILITNRPSMNVAFVTKEKDLLMPAFDKILSGCTAKRVHVLTTSKEGLVKEVGQSGVIGDGKEGPITRALLALILEDMKSGPPAVRVPVP
ncbi:hypothetical protein D5086_031657 [Populus alba]|uniref:Uncharacterized protein n=1 Tax=Populus alba TaxID=43335 RepID=A0ACC4AK36_POPAL